LTFISIFSLFLKISIIGVELDLSLIKIFVLDLINPELLSLDVKGL